MTTHIITTDSSTQLNVTTSSDTWILDGGVSIVSKNEGISNYFTREDTTIIVEGTIYAQEFAKSGVYSEGLSAEIQISQTGIIDAFNGVSVRGMNSSVVNDGTIQVNNLGIYGKGSYLHLENSGSIVASKGMYIEDAGFSTVDNFGTIVGKTGIVVNDSAVQVNVGASGIIDVTETGILFLGDRSSVLENEGSITSDGLAIVGSVASETIVNHGTIKGAIQLGDGNDFFDNRGGKIDHAIDGGAGNDGYVLNSAADKIIDVSGSDTISATFSANLTGYATIESLMLIGTGNINASGNELVNALMGNEGNNVLDGTGDGLVDSLAGGYGNDTYVLGSEHDTVLEYGDAQSAQSAVEAVTGSGKGENDGNGPFETIDDPAPSAPSSAAEALIRGIDTITSTISRDLSDYGYIENLKLLGTANINGTGNDLANVITGNAGNNILNGGVENTAVKDILNGGAGNDTYVMGSGADTIIDSVGTDTITSSISRSLASYATIENLTLTGASDLNATGNALNNVLTGNAGINKLDGGAGNDTYVLGSGAFDSVVDAAGTDLVTSLISRNLATFSTIENLKLLGVSDINAIGNSLSNTLTGNLGVNILSGGMGNDVLIGGAGADKLDGGDNDDTASYAGASAGVVANLGTSSLNTGDAKGDTYVSIENVRGTSHSDMLTGNSAGNVLFGEKGSDTLTGGGGADTFLFKSSGESTFAMAGQDTILDFSHAQGDRINLSSIDANSTATGDQAFAFKGAAAFSGIKGELRFDKQASDTYVYGDTNGDKVADFAIHFDDAIAFQASDFVF